MHKDIPKLEGWMTIPEAATIMKLSRQYAHRIAVAGGFTSLHRIGSTFIVSEWEVNDLIGRYEKLDTDS